MIAKLDFEKLFHRLHCLCYCNRYIATSLESSHCDDHFKTISFCFQTFLSCFIDILTLSKLSGTLTLSKIVLEQWKVVHWARLLLSITLILSKTSVVPHKYSESAITDNTVILIVLPTLSTSAVSSFCLCLVQKQLKCHSDHVTIHFRPFFYKSIFLHNHIPICDPFNLLNSTHQESAYLNRKRIPKFNTCTSTA